MGRPGFWDDQEEAARTSAAHARAQRKLKTFEELESEAGDLDELAEMAAEDEEMAVELATQMASVERRLAELEEARLFSGQYDAGDAVVTVHAGAGGTDSQDWAEILLRMYLRWAERRGFEVEMKEASPGRRRGSSRRPSSPTARTPTGSSPPSAASTAWCGSPPSTPRPAATPASPRSTSARSSTRGSRSRYDDDLRVDTYRASAPAASTSTRPTRRCGSPTSRPASSCSARTSARRRRTRRWRCSCCARS